MLARQRSTSSSRRGVGVCGRAIAGERNIIVDDVTTEANLACSLGTRSELVELIRDEGEIVGQCDIDRDNPAEFTSADVEFLEGLAAENSPVCRAVRDRPRGEHFPARRRRSLKRAPRTCPSARRQVSERSVAMSYSATVASRMAAC